MRSRLQLQDKNLIEKGFTLVELLVVIVILGILAAVVVFAVGGITNKGNSSACKIEVRTINTANQAFLAQSTLNPPAYPTGTTVAGMITQLASANLIPAGTIALPATAPYAPAYAAGIYTASCP